MIKLNYNKNLRKFKLNKNKNKENLIFNYKITFNKMLSKITFNN